MGMATDERLWIDACNVMNRYVKALNSTQMSTFHCAVQLINLILEQGIDKIIVIVTGETMWWTYYDIRIRDSYAIFLIRYRAN